MKIEDVIKSTGEIKDKHHRAYLNVVYSGIWLEQSSVEPLKKVGLTHPQYNVLRIVNGYKKPIAVASIQQRMLFKTSNVTRIIDRLVSKNLLTKDVWENDRRVMLVDITPQGKEILDKLHGEIYSLVQNVLGKNLSMEEIVTLGNLLDKMRM